ncbi:hypothetical protein ACFWE5_05455 [Cellulosimicrobium funkei]|uniref:hypothetical protein n=1 Tax=Cellulosimicrobium funkei TaxID=264251 RepID=UPI003648DC28
MATKKTKTTTTSSKASESADLATRAYELASAREAAEARAEDARAAAQAATELLGDLRRRVREGDASVTALDLLAAEADVPRTAQIQTAIDAAVEAARAAEAPVRAQYVAARISEGTELPELASAVDATVATIGTAIDTLSAAVSERASAVRAVMHELENGGATDGYRSMQRGGEAGYDDTLPVWISSNGTLTFEDGRKVVPPSTPAVVMRALARAVNAQGLRFTPLTAQVGLELAPSGPSEDVAIRATVAAGDRAVADARTLRSELEDAAAASRASKHLGRP